MARYKRGDRTRAANDNLSPLKIALRDWADREQMVGGNTKALLCRLASHADAIGTVFICRERFANLLGVKVRTITECTRRLLEEGLIAATGELVIRPSVAYKVYLLAPHEDAIQALARRAVGVRSGMPDDRSGEFRPTYKEDSKTSNLAPTARVDSGATFAAPPLQLAPVPENVRVTLATWLTAEEMFSYVTQAMWQASPPTLIARTELARIRLEALLHAANDVGFSISSMARKAAYV